MIKSTRLFSAYAMNDEIGTYHCRRWAARTGNLRIWRILRIDANCFWKEIGVGRLKMVIYRWWNVRLWFVQKFLETRTLNQNSTRGNSLWAMGLCLCCVFFFYSFFSHTLNIWKLFFAPLNQLFKVVPKILKL
jgi:hypothetical protein